MSDVRDIVGDDVGPEELGRLQLGLQLQGGVGETRLVEVVARRGLVQARDVDHMPDGPKLRDGAGEGRTRVPHVPAKTDEGAHAARTLADASPAGRRVTPPGVSLSRQG